MRKILLQLTLVAGLMLSLLASSAMAEIYNFGLQFKENTTKTVNFFNGANVNNANTAEHTMSIANPSLAFSFNTSSLAAQPGIDGFTLFLQATGVMPTNQYMGMSGMGGSEMPMWMQDVSVSLFDTGTGWVRVGSLDSNLTPFVPAKNGPVDAVKIAKSGGDQLLANNTFFTSLYIPGMPTNNPDIQNTFAQFADEILSGKLYGRIDFDSVSASDSIKLYGANLQVSSVPVPGAIWLLGSGLAALVGLRRKSAPASY